MVGDDRASHEENDEIAKFFVWFWKLMGEAARRQLDKKPGWEPKHNNVVARALGVAPSTVGHWRKGENFPRAEMVTSVLALAGVAPDKQPDLLAWREKVHLLWVDRRSALGLDSVSAEAPTTRGAEGPLEPAITQSCDSVDVQADEDVALSASTESEDVTDVLHAAGEELEHGPAKEGMPVMTVSSLPRDEEQQAPPQHDEVSAESSHRGSPADPLTKATAELAKNVGAQWEAEAAERGLDIPPPIPPRWIRTQRPVTGPIEVAVGSVEQRNRFPALAGSVAATADTVQGGGLGELFTVYAGLGSGRIVLMGDYGSGKTATAILMLLDALDRRVGLPPDNLARTPVPVLLNAREWDPRRHDLADWFTRQLATVYDFLQSSQYGPDAAAELVRSGRVALFLDGFDEMDENLRAVGLRRINRQHRAFRLVLLTRIAEFADVVEAERLHLHGAAALELLPVSRDDAVNYLSNCQRSPAKDGDELQQLIDHSRRQPEDPVSQALDTPLNLALIHEDPRAVDELLTSHHFEDRDQVEAFLLGRVVPVSYAPGRRLGPRTDQAQRWLGYLATRMDRNDMAWWQMHHWAPAWQRVLFNTLIGIVLMSCIGALVFSPVGQYTMTGHTGVLFGAGYGAAMGALFGVVATLISELREPHPKWESRFRSAIQRRSPRILQWLPRFAFNPAIGLFIFAVVTIAVGNQASYLYSPFAGVIGACTAGHAATRIRVTSGTQPWWTSVQPNRTDLLAATVIGLPIGLTYGLTKTPLFGIIAGLITGFTFGLMASVARPLSDTDIPPDPNTRWRRDRHRTLIVGPTAAIPIGLALGFQNGRAHGLLAGITATIGLGTIIGLGSMIGISDIWRTALLFVQLRIRGVFPLRGMEFLNDAREREVLRTAGPKFQFKHDRLRVTLAETYQAAQRPDGP